MLMKSDDQVKFQAIRACSGPAQRPCPSQNPGYAVETRILEPTKIYAEGFGAKIIANISRCTV